MRKYEIKTATAEYTGGGIYIYYGQLSDGNWLRACDGWDFIEICNADTSVEDADYCEFYEEHSIETLTAAEYEEFWNQMLLWIIHNAPKGNYSADELESRLIESNTSESGLILGNEGYYYISEKGIKYSLLEGLTIGGKERYTSDIIIIALLDADINVNENLVGFLYGANCLATNPSDYAESIKRIVDEYESKNL